MTAAQKLEVFDIIDKLGNQASVEQVAGEKAYDVNYTRRLLNALTAIEILERNGSEQKGTKTKL